MSVDHKRPLLAFAVVTIASVVILVNAVRSEAFVSLLRAETSHVVAGLGLAPVDHRPGHRLEREHEAARLVAAPEVVVPVQQPRGTPHHRGLRADRGPYPAHEHAHGHGERARGHDGDPDGRRAHRHGREHGREHGHHRGHGDHADGDHGHGDRRHGHGHGDRGHGHRGHAKPRELGHPRSAGPV